jgi:AcrR family transcriptional regulator
MTTDTARTTPASSGSTGPSKPLTRRGELTRAKLLAAGREIFEEHGFLDARITDIAARARVAHGTFYTYFSSKDEIFREIALAIADELAAPLGDVILDPSSKATPAERISQAIRQHLERYRANARLMGVIEQVSRHDPVLEAARIERQSWGQSLVADSIARLQRHGLVDPRIDPEIAVLILGAMTERFPEMWLTQGRLDCSFDEAVEQLSLIYTNALGLTQPS